MRSVPVHQRDFGLMFQNYALFPHLDVSANVAFGLRMQGWPTQKMQHRVKEMLQLVDLENMAHRDVTALSGGEQQRVALARSLAPQPKLLMLDEPIGALDRTLRDRLIEKLSQILKQVGVTVLYVTHDQSEAFAIADRIFLIRDGQIIQRGTPEQVYRQPRSVWTARFLGMQNILHGEWIAPGTIQTSIGPLYVDGTGSGPVAAVIRPEAAAIGTTDQETSITGEIIARSFLGTTIHLVLRCSSGDRLAFTLPATESGSAQGESITLSVRSDGIVCLDADNDQRTSG
jgi:ABC-type Fe3+/spermidine/putrescine transport system ATPase subunit